MYIRLIMLAFLFNGLGVFGLHIVSGSGAAQVDRLQYIALWYAAGLAVAAFAYYRKNGRLLKSELLIGASMGLCSLGGISGITLALSAGVPGFIVFPVAMGGGVLLVCAVGIGFFGERMGPAGYAGLALGMAALVLLALP